jgi:hypothetical protein
MLTGFQLIIGSRLASEGQADQKGTLSVRLPEIKVLITGQMSSCISYDNLDHVRLESLSRIIDVSVEPCALYSRRWTCSRQTD